jgi:predicted nucleotidyltransferase
MLQLDLPRDAISLLCRRHRIRRLAVFGSALRDDFAPDSDVDLLVEFDPDAKVGLKFFAIEDELAAIIGRKVDLNTAGFLNQRFRDRVVAEAQVIYEGP